MYMEWTLYGTCEYLCNNYNLDCQHFVLRDIDNVELQELLITGHGGPGLIRTKIISVIEYVIMQNIKTFQDS